MKKVLTGLLIVAISMVMAGCTETKSSDEDGNSKRDFNISETAIVNNTKIKINAIKKIEKECLWEYDGKCQSWKEPDNDIFIVIDLTIENTGDDDLSISSMMSFELKDKNGNKGIYALLTNSIKSQLDGKVMKNDKLTGQIGYDVKSADIYNFYFKNSLLDNSIKFIINPSDIQ